jgi:hypothetical protein
MFSFTNKMYFFFVGAITICFKFTNTHFIRAKVAEERMSGLFETTFLTSRHAVTSARSRYLNTEFGGLGDKLWRSR